MPLISVIVPVYKVEPYLRKCLDSILAQTHRELQIILVDDGSPDSCGAICDEYAATDTRITVIHQPNVGLSAARNAGLEIANGEYVGFVDSDDWIEPDMYETLYTLVQKANADITICGYFQWTEGKPLTTLAFSDKCDLTTNGIIQEVYVRKSINTAVWNRLYKRSLFDDIRFPVGQLSEDVVTSYRLFCLANTIACTSVCKYNYLYRINNISNSAYNAHSFTVLEEWENLVQLAHHLTPQFEPRIFATMMAEYVRMYRKLFFTLRQKNHTDYSAEYRQLLLFLDRYYTRAMRTPQLAIKFKAVLFIARHELCWPFRMLGKQSKEIRSDKEL